MKSEIEQILASSTVNGGAFWSRHDGDIHTPSGFSTIDVLNTLGDLGITVNDDELLQQAIAFVFTYYDPQGSFKYSAKSAKLPCITARILTALGRLGYTGDPRIESCYKQFLEAQEEDGGWRCATVKRGKSPQTDASNPGTTLYILDAFRYRENTAGEQAQLNQAVSFLLNHWRTREPLGPCAFGIGSRFLSIEYPFLRYNLFYYVYILSKYQAARDNACYQSARQTLIDKSVDQKIYPESPHKAWREFSFARKGAYSEIATRRFLEIRNET